MDISEAEDLIECHERIHTTREEWLRAIEERGNCDYDPCGYMDECVDKAAQEHAEAILHFYIKMALKCK